MKSIPPVRRFFILALALAASSASRCAAETAAAAPRLHQTCDFNWRFFRGAATWRKPNLPHDWSVEEPFDEKAPTGGSGGYLPAGAGWYRKTSPRSDAMQGRKISVEFDGVYETSDVWINDEHLCRQPTSAKWPVPS